MVAIEQFEVLKSAFQPLDAKSYLRGFPSRDDYDTLIDSPTLLVDAETEKLVAAYLYLSPALLPTCLELTPALATARYNELSRASGMETKSFVFGYVPRRHYRTNAYCHASRVSGELNDALLSLGRAFEQIYAALAPARYEEHREAASSLRSEYRYTEVFTSGVVNKDSAIAYHFDKGNLHGAWSAMLYLTKGIADGVTVFPEYRVAFAPADTALVYFPGSVLLHGVMPFQKLTPDAYRYTIVYYTLRSLWQCLPPPEEYKRYLSWRTEYERRVAREGRQYLANYETRRRKR